MKNPGDEKKERQVPCRLNRQDLLFLRQEGTEPISPQIRRKALALPVFRPASGCSVRRGAPAGTAAGKRQQAAETGTVLDEHKTGHRK